MTDILDMEIWIGLIGLTCILYLIKFLQGRNKTKVYRVSPESLQRSKQVIMHVLPLVEEGDARQIIDAKMLHYSKEQVKSAAKILAYYYWKNSKLEELGRVKNCFISLSRFQPESLAEEARQRQAQKEYKRLAREYECYITHSPSKAA